MLLLLALKPALSRSVGLPVFRADRPVRQLLRFADVPRRFAQLPLILLIALETKTTISFGGLMRERSCAASAGKRSAMPACGC
ncbi:MAG: hypothetical protein ACLUI3_16870 [Christensenellales bacterium]